MSEFGPGYSPEEEPVQPEETEQNKEPQRERQQGNEGALRMEVFEKYGKDGIPAINALEMHDPHDIISATRELEIDQLVDVAETVKAYGLDSFNLDAAVKYRRMESEGVIGEQPNAAAGAEKIQEIFRR